MSKLKECFNINSLIEPELKEQIKPTNIKLVCKIRQDDEDYFEALSAVGSVENYTSRCYIDEKMIAAIKNNGMFSYNLHYIVTISRINEMDFIAKIEHYNAKRYKPYRKRNKKEQRQLMKELLELTAQL
ncbi:MAG: hypothetical protein KAI17_19490 [Thiotrichaceae bacterium]|nr:hypothetical protein [Thiotrichaceae bacterium]